MRNLFRKILTVSYARSNLGQVCKLHTKGSKEKQKNKLVSSVLTRYVNLVKKCEETFPTAAKFYKTFSSGIKEFKNDSLLLFNVYKKLSFDGIYCLSRKELEVYHEMPKNIVKVTPFIIGAALPFGAALFAVGCMFPKRTLSPHFWSETQKNEFALIDHRKRLQHYGSVITCMESRLKLITFYEAIKNWERILNASAKKEIAMTQTKHWSVIQYHTILFFLYEGLKSGITPTVNEIIGCKQLFQEPPFSLRCLGTSHTSHLLHVHNLHRGWRRKSRLEQFAALMKAMDTAIVAEGGLNKLTPTELQWASFFRGLNPNNMSSENIRLWLNNWLLISKEIDESCHSLLLHCPVLLGFNEPSNVALLKDYRM